MASFAPPIPIPDPNTPVPLSNKTSTIYGATLPFHILTWAAVVFRLYTRFRVVRDPGWDDHLIALCSVMNMISLVGLYAAHHYGLGEHLVDIDQDRLQTLFKSFYVHIGGYYTCAGLVKLSLLCQYLRLFKQGIVRKVCIVLLVLISLWSFLWFFQGWAPCFPVSGFWNRTQQPPPKCWGTDPDKPESAVVLFVAFAASNMTLDTIIFLIPIHLLLKPNTAGKQVLALMGLFSLGSIVLLMSILRLWTALRNDENDPRTFDITWWYPLTMIMSSLEIDFAIICASIPIFWPVIVSSLPQIFVTKEVRVTHHQRVPDGTNTDYEMESVDFAIGLGNDSQENLTTIHDIKTDYRDQLVVDHVIGKIESSTEVVVQKPKRK